MFVESIVFLLAFYFLHDTIAVRSVARSEQYEENKCVKVVVIIMIRIRTRVQDTNIRSFLLLHLLKRIHFLFLDGIDSIVTNRTRKSVKAREVRVRRV